MEARKQSAGLCPVTPRQSRGSFPLRPAAGEGGPRPFVMRPEGGPRLLVPGVARRRALTCTRCGQEAGLTCIWRGRPPPPSSPGRSRSAARRERTTRSPRCARRSGPRPGCLPHDAAGTPESSPAPAPRLSCRPPPRHSRPRGAPSPHLSQCPLRAKGEARAQTLVSYLLPAPGHPQGSDPGRAGVRTAHSSRHRPQCPGAHATRKGPVLAGQNLAPRMCQNT